MPTQNLELEAAIRRSKREVDECVLLIEPHPEEAKRLLNELNSAADEGFRAEWVSEPSSGIEKLRVAGISAVVLGITPGDVNGIETVVKLFHIAPRVPILVLCTPDDEDFGRQMVKHGRTTTY
jgi:DNA-binding response OmpR family regulator